jgi:ATP-dependent protease ClpP protease subunit
MTRPQATTAILPISNRSMSTVPAFASRFMTEDKAAQVHGWYNISSKKKADKVTAEILIYGEIGWEVTANEFVKDMAMLEADHINVHVNSPGGDVFDGIAIYNSLRMHSATVTIYVDALAASAASFIAQAGDEVIMLRNAEMMIHDASALAWGNEEVMLDVAGLLSRISNNIADIYAQRAGGTLEDWRAIMKAEMWYTAQEAVDAGLADSVLDSTDEDAAEAKNGWDLKVFNFAGRNEAPSPVERVLEITNRAKEAPVSGSTTTPSNEGETTPTTTEAPAAPEATETEATETEATEAEASEPVQTEGEHELDTELVPTASALAPGVFVVNGMNTTDQRAVQAHITTLEAFYSETRDANRQAFIASLASGPAPKIAATQIETLKELVGSMDDKQYDLWVASWDAAPNVSLFGSHGEQDGGSPTGTAASATSERIETLKAIVDRHVRGGMSKEQIEATKSYNELKQLDPEFTLNK